MELTTMKRKGAGVKGEQLVRQEYTYLVSSSVARFANWFVNKVGSQLAR